MASSRGQAAGGDPTESLLEEVSPSVAQSRSTPQVSCEESCLQRQWTTHQNPYILPPSLGIHLVQKLWPPELPGHGQDCHVMQNNNYLLELFWSVKLEFVMLLPHNQFQECGSLGIMGIWILLYFQSSTWEASFLAGRDFISSNVEPWPLNINVDTRKRNKDKHCCCGRSWHGRDSPQ